MRTFAIACLLAFLACTVRADDKVAEVQQLLKNGGYYFGEITGEKDADTTAAIRRYQIRNGLEISGDLNDATYKSIRATASASSSSAAIAARPSAAPQNQPDEGVSPNEEAETVPQPPRQMYQLPRQPQADGGVPGQPVPVRGGFFAGTPYDNAPPDVQEDVVMRAQKRLAKREMYRGQITGVISPDLQFSLRAYQSRVGLEPTGRLDLQTLAALELLPGANERVYIPRRPMRVPPGVAPPVRGEWIRP